MGLSGNEAGSGGGIRSDGGLTTLTNSTLSGNEAVSDGGGIWNTGGTVTLVNSTLWGNTAGAQGDGVLTSADLSAETILRNTIVAGSQDASGDCALDFGGEVSFSGVSLVQDGSCGCDGESSCLSGDPRLDEELADNGGPTRTHALLANSPAIDKIEAGGEPGCLQLDQRGVVRGVDGDGDGSSGELAFGCDIGAFEAGGLGPEALAVDSQGLDSDGNGVLEAGEAVVVVPTWRNLGAPVETGLGSPLLTGTASAFTGPAGANYSLLHAEVSYLAPPLGETTTCAPGGSPPASRRQRISDAECYAVEIVPAGERPVLHWDASLTETVNSGPSIHIWPLHVGESFPDVPRTHLFYRPIETVLHAGIVEALAGARLTGGCGGGAFCPATATSRAEMPMFLLKAVGGPDFVPPECEEADERRFADVPFDEPACPWVEELARRGVTAGCGGGNYCPEAPVTRGQMAVFLLEALGVEPQGCDGTFADVPCSSLFADWIEELAERGITAGCAADPAAYCPASAVTRAQMAAFTTKTFELALYGP
ncbi:MAG: choice-of-anchor Q domain-containing protein [Thermoanaerobaculia bacterium]